MSNRIIGCVLALLLFAPALVWAQTPPLTPKERKDRAVAAEIEMDAQELVALEKETAHALALNNPSFFERVYSEDYVGSFSSGEIRNKNSLISSIQHSTITYSTFVVSDINVRVYGPTAVVNCTWSVRGAQNGHSFARQYRVIHVYVNNRVGGWKAVAGQETLLPG